MASLSQGALPGQREKAQHRFSCYSLFFECAIQAFGSRDTEKAFCVKPITNKNASFVGVVRKIRG